MFEEVYCFQNKETKEYLCRHKSSVRRLIARKFRADLQSLYNAIMDNNFIYYGIDIRDYEIVKRVLRVEEVADYHLYATLEQFLPDAGRPFYPNTENNCCKAMMVCEACGKDNLDPIYNFCPNCGRKFFHKID